MTQFRLCKQFCCTSVLVCTCMYGLYSVRRKYWLIRKWVTCHIDLSRNGSQVMLTYQEMGHKSCWLIRKWITSQADLSGNGSQFILSYQEMGLKPCWLIRKWVISHADLWVISHVDLSGNGSEVILTCQEKGHESYPRLDKNVGFWLVDDLLVQNPCYWLVVT
jgi:hypothetical protein